MGALAKQFWGQIQGGIQQQFGAGGGGGGWYPQGIGGFGSPQQGGLHQSQGGQKKMSRSRSQSYVRYVLQLKDDL